MALVFPAPGGVYQSEIPLWFNIRSIPYTDYDGKKTPKSYYDGNGVSCISVPVPDLITNKNDVNYTNAPEIFNGQGGFWEKPIAQAGIALKYYGNKGWSDKNLASRSRLDDISQRTARIASTNHDYLYTNMMDQMFLAGAAKTYDFKFLLKCKSRQDSINASAICNILSSKIWPKIKTPSGGGSNRHNLSGFCRIDHPDVWVFWISEVAGSPLPILHWLDSTPQVCVLTSAVTQRLGNDNGALGMYTDLGPIPFMYSVTLSFIEIEPTYQDQYGTPNTTNRSASDLTGGTLTP